MQEDIENKSINFVVRATKVTVTALYKGMKACENYYRNKQKQKPTEKKTVKGEQPVKKLIGQGQGVSTVPISDGGIRKFKRICNRYGVDFAIVKDKTKDSMQYSVFFKARDADAITKILEEYSSKIVKKKEQEKPSILQTLKKFKEMVANMPKKEQEKIKEKIR